MATLQEMKNVNVGKPGYGYWKFTDVETERRNVEIGYGTWEEACEFCDSHFSQMTKELIEPKWDKVCYAFNLEEMNERRRRRLRNK